MQWHVLGIFVWALRLSYPRIFLGDCLNNRGVRGVLYVAAQHSYLQCCFFATYKVFRFFSARDFNVPSRALLVVLWLRDASYHVIMGWNIFLLH